MSTRRETGGLIVAIVAVSFNLRLATAAVPPLLPAILSDTGLSTSGGGVLVALPLFCFGACAPLAPLLARRLGAERTIAGALVALIAGIMLRSAPGLVPLFGGTLVLGAAITCGNVLLPSVIKRGFPERAGPLLGLYSTALTAGAALGAAATVPLLHAIGWGWRAPLAFWALGATAAMLLWLPQVIGARVTTPDTVLSRTPARRLYRDGLAWHLTVFFGVQSCVYNAAVSWLPALLVTHGLPQATAGFMLAIINLTGMVTTFVIPILALRRATQGTLVVVTVALLATSVTGLLVAPVAGIYIWMVLFGLGQGAALGLALSLVVLRSADARQAAALSGMTQTAGYLLSALGPIGLGVVHDRTGGWQWPLRVLLVLLVPLLLAGLAGSRQRSLCPPCAP